MDITLFKNMTSRQSSDGMLEQVANIIRTDEYIKAFTNLEFKRLRTNSSRGFIVVCRTAEEMRIYQHTLLSKAQLDTDDGLPY